MTKDGAQAGTLAATGLAWHNAIVLDEPVPEGHGEVKALVTP